MTTAIGATVLTPVAYAQTSADYAEQQQHCEALRALSSEQSDRLRAEWVQESRSVVEAGNQERCQTYYDQANEALGPNGQQMDREAAARIVVTQPDPEVNVRQQAPLVSVTQQEPRVRVDQGQPQIIVRQAQPNVRVQIPQPIITIDQPQPEIIVRMPEPDVAVTNPKPQVEVRQQPPQVNVTQPEPQVSVQADQSQASQADQDDSNVDLQRQEPRVQVQSTGNEAQIDVQRQQPNVQYEQAEPNIQVERQGEPEIRFNQTGEPNIRFEDAGASQQVGQRGDDNAQRDMQRAREMLRQDQQMEAGQPLDYYAGDLRGLDLRNARDQQLGTIDRVILDGNRHYVVLTDGQRLGLGDQEVAIPLDTISVIDGVLILRGMSQEDINAMSGVDTQNAQALGNDDRVEIGSQ
ncbi:PRC-barrel domain-containing protein [Devosia salina]|uniref:PRC-barrel domain-containing protein n=1 Tax=Devosia salina TaxID=2860336 RepID=A0ABX8WKC7_9HYPH|nr:PRC-barrel domain-containing protein [Devosia salina]QYO78204.1 PRC-barrel domain-containing protein [Devosia salina]